MVWWYIARAGIEDQVFILHTSDTSSNLGPWCKNPSAKLSLSIWFHLKKYQVHIICDHSAMQTYNRKHYLLQFKDSHLIQTLIQLHAPCTLVDLTAVVFFPAFSYIFILKQLSDPSSLCLINFPNRREDNKIKALVLYRRCKF